MNPVHGRVPHLVHDTASPRARGRPAYVETRSRAHVCLPCESAATGRCFSEVASAAGAPGVAATETAVPARHRVGCRCGRARAGWRHIDECGKYDSRIRGVRSSSCFRWSLRSLRVASSAIGSLRYRSTVSSDRWFPLNKPTRIQITGASQVSIDTWNCCRRFDAVATGGSCGSGMRRRSDVADLVSCTIPKRLLCVSRSRSEHA